MDNSVASLPTQKEKIIAGLAQVSRNLIDFKRAKGNNLTVLRGEEIVSITPKEAEQLLLSALFTQR